MTRARPVRKTHLNCSSLYHAPASHFSDPQTVILPFPSCRALGISVRLCNPWSFHLQNGYVKMKRGEAIGVWDGLCFTVNTPQINAIIMQRKLISLHIILTCSSAQTEHFLYWGNLGCMKNDVHLCQILLRKHQGKGQFAWFQSMACEKIMGQYVRSGTFWQLWQQYHCSLPSILFHTDHEDQIRQWICLHQGLSYNLPNSTHAYTKKVCSYGPLTLIYFSFMPRKVVWQMGNSYCFLLNNIP